VISNYLFKLICSSLPLGFRIKHPCHIRRRDIYTSGSKKFQLKICKKRFNFYFLGEIGKELYKVIVFSEFLGKLKINEPK